MKSLWNFLGEFWQELSATLAVAFLIAIATKLRRSYFFHVARQLLPGLRSSGLVQAYSNTRDAAGAIAAAVSQTRDLKILSNKGTDWLGDDNAILSQVISRRPPGELKLRILLLSRDAPWLNRWAEERGRSPIAVHEEFETAHRFIEAFMERHRNLRHKSGIRYHRDDPVWRLVITDERAFVSTYTNEGQARDGIVLEFQKEGSPIFRAFHRYFNFLWHARGKLRAAITESEFPAISYNSVELSAGGCVYARDETGVKIVLVERQDGLMTLPKGHVRDDEELISAALREINEETGIPVEDLMIQQSLGWFLNPLFIEGQGYIIKIVYYYIVKYSGSGFPPLKSDPDHRSARWCLLSGTNNLRFAYAHVEEVIRRTTQAVGNA